MIDLITKENSFYALYNEPFGDILKAFYIKSPTPALLGMVADAPAPVDKEVTHIAKNVVQFAVQRIEISGVKGDPRQIVSQTLNEIDRQLKVKKLTNGILCCSVIFIYDGFLYIGGVGDCTIAPCNDRGVLRFCHDSPNEPRPTGVENLTVAPAELMGLNHEARLGDLPTQYSDESVYQLETDPSLNICMFSDGLTKHLPDFFLDLVGRRAEDVFTHVNENIPEDTDQLLDDICFTIFKIPPELAPKQVQYPPRNRKSNPIAIPETGGKRSSSKRKSKNGDGSSESEEITREHGRSSGCAFWILFMMVFAIMLMVASFGLWAAYEWLTFKSQVLESFIRP